MQARGRNWSAILPTRSSRRWRSRRVPGSAVKRSLSLARAAKRLTSLTASSKTGPSTPTRRDSVATDRRLSMALKPWYKVITPREDLRDGRPLDASEFAVHLDHVRDGRAPDDYKKPERFFDRTFLTSSLCELGGGVVRRLSGIKVETSAVYNLTTQFGGGKTHALTSLYHLASAGLAASNWKGVQALLDKAGV